jgi:hypothetical protein
LGCSHVITGLSLGARSRNIGVGFSCGAEPICKGVGGQAGVRLWGAEERRAWGGAQSAHQQTYSARLFE